MSDDNVPSIHVDLSEPLGDGFDFPQDVSDLELAFPATVAHLMPVYEAIPEEFKRRQNEWTAFVQQWFFRGWPADLLLYTRPTVDAEKAFKHLTAIMRSFEPKHEHKEAAVAWLLSRWYAAIRPVEKEA